MILEHAILHIRAGQAAGFEQALREALPLISATPGFHSLAVHPCVETADRYLLLVRWDSLAAHTQGFRGSPRYQQWKQLLHHFYEPFPLVEHYGEAIASA